MFVVYCAVQSYADGVSRARSAAPASCKLFSIVEVSGCAPPRTRRAVLSISSSVVTASRRSSSVAAAAQYGQRVVGVRGMMKAMGGIYEGLRAETTFNQWDHLIAFIMLDAGLALHIPYYLRLIA